MSTGKRSSAHGIDVGLASCKAAKTWFITRFKQRSLSDDVYLR